MYESSTVKSRTRLMSNASKKSGGHEPEPIDAVARGAACRHRDPRPSGWLPSSRPSPLRTRLLGLRARRPCGIVGLARSRSRSWLASLVSTIARHQLARRLHSAAWARRCARRYSSNARMTAPARAHRADLALGNRFKSSGSRPLPSLGNRLSVTHKTTSALFHSSRGTQPSKSSGTGVAQPGLRVGERGLELRADGPMRADEDHRGCRAGSAGVACMARALAIALDRARPAMKNSFVMSPFSVDAVGTEPQGCPG